MNSCFEQFNIAKVLEDVVKIDIVIIIAAIRPRSRCRINLWHSECTPGGLKDLPWELLVKIAGCVSAKHGLRVLRGVCSEFKSGIEATATTISMMGGTQGPVRFGGRFPLLQRYYHSMPNMTWSERQVLGKCFIYVSLHKCSKFASDSAALWKFARGIQPYERKISKSCRRQEIENVRVA